MPTFHLKIKSGSNSSGHYDYVIRDKENIQTKMILFTVNQKFRTIRLYTRRILEDVYG